MGLGDLISKADDIAEYLDKCATDRLLDKVKECLLCLNGNSGNSGNITPSLCDLFVFLKTLNDTNVLHQVEDLQAKLRRIQDSTNDDEAEPLSDQLVGAIDGALGCIQVVSLRSNTRLHK